MSAKVFENNFFKNIPLSTFKGHPKENVQDWLSELDEYLRAVNATPAQKVTAARLLMRDNARRWLKLCPATPDTADPWEYFKKCVQARFLSANHKYFSRSRLYELKQRGSVTKYIADFQDICSEIDDISEPEALQAFLMGLKPRIQVHFAGNPMLREDLSTVMQVAESLDNVQYQNRNRFPAQWSRPANQESFPQPMELDMIRAHPNTQSKFQRPSMKNEIKQKDFSENRCFYCHEPGHMIRSCPAYNKKQSNSRAH
jgi:hypothetical protein